MIVIAGHLEVDPSSRAAYLAGCREIVRRARAADGCLDFALAPDLLDAGRVNVLERWQSRSALQAFRGAGPADDLAGQILHADVREYEVVAAQSL